MSDEIVKDDVNASEASEKEAIQESPKETPKETPKPAPRRSLPDTRGSRRPRRARTSTATGRTPVPATSGRSCRSI